MNVKSIIGKLPDIESDTNLTNASILCFCETWLVPTQELPLIREGHTVLRCDRTVENNHGGVLLSLPQHMSHRNVIRINLNGIEVLVTTLLLSDSYNLQLVLLYRSPSVSLQCLINTLIDLFNEIDPVVPTVLMGDILGPAPS